MKNIMLQEFKLRSVKIFDIGYVTVIYFIIGIIFAKLFDKIFGTFDEKKEKDKSFLRRSLDLIGLMWLSGIVIYIVKNIVELIPSPFDGMYGFDHMKLKELKSGAVFTVIFLLFQSYFKGKLQYYYNNLKIF